MTAPRRCHYCGVEVRPMEWGESRPHGVAFNWDHVVPRSWGGRHKVRSCVQCNDKKGSSAPTCQCRACTTAVHEWLGRMVRQPTLPSQQRKRVHKMLAAYVLAETQIAVRDWRWWVDSEGRETVSIFRHEKGTVVTLWCAEAGTLTRVDSQVEHSLWEMAVAEGRPHHPSRTRVM